jgi:uncharacterized protein (DUF433 family)
MTEDLLDDCPQLNRDDVREARRFAVAHVDQRTIARDHAE